MRPSLRPCASGYSSSCSVSPPTPVEVRRDGAWVGRAHLDTWQLVDDGDGPHWRAHVYRYGVDEHGRPALRTEWYDAGNIRPATAG